MSRMGTLLRVGMAWLAAATAVFAGDGPAEPFTGEMEVTLVEALFRDDRPQPERRVNLVLHFEASGGRWEPTWGTALNFNNGTHIGVVREATVRSGRIDLDVSMLIGRDRWAEGGPAVYAIRLTRAPSGELKGTFQGTFLGKEVSGEAYGEINPPRPVVVDGFQPVEPGEHPRVLFRKSDLPGLQKKLRTPLGKAYLAKAEEAADLVSLGMLYQLTGQRNYAEKAEALIRQYDAEHEEGIAKNDGPGSGGFGHRFVRVCLAYDLCYDAWPEDFRNWLEARTIEKIALFQVRLPTGHANYHPCSNYYGPGRGVPAIGSLCLWGVKGPAPERPIAPPSEPVAPAKGYKPGKGVPVVKFADNEMPGEWIYAGGFRPQPDQDPLASLGGPGGVRPQVGTAVRFGGRAEAFRPLSHEPDRGYWTNENYTDGKLAIDITNAIGREYHSTSYFYTVVENDKPRTVQLLTAYSPAAVYLAGVRLRDRDVAQIDRGLYPLLVVAPIGETRPWGRILMRPRFVEKQPAEAEALIAVRRQRYAVDLALSQREQELWEASGGVDPRVQRFLAKGYRQVYQHYRLGIGDGGFQAETGGYAQIATWYPLVYAGLYRNFFGREVSGYPDVSHLMPRRMMQVTFLPDGETTAEKINSVVGIEGKWCAAAWPIVPERYRPAMLWAWHHVAGVKDGQSAANMLEGDGLSMALAFVHYPLELEPVHPGQVMPRTWEAPTFGYYCFRSGWQSQDDFIAQVFLKASLVKGWNHGNAGTFRIYGLGHGWVTTPESRNGVRAQEPVVYLPDDEHNRRACGRLAFLKTEPDGSGALTVDLSDVYAATRTYETPSGPRSANLYDSNLIRLPESFADSGISGLRAFAFDYSGRSGAPCLMVLVDRIRGGKQKVWQWQLPEGTLDKVTIDGNVFTLDYGDASMRATFLAPAQVKLEAGTEMIQVGDPRHGFHGEITRVKATGGDHFFVVITFQRGKAPAVTVRGAGLDARATVGRQEISFDGERVLIE